MRDRERQRGTERDSERQRQRERNAETESDSERERARERERERERESVLVWRQRGEEQQFDICSHPGLLREGWVLISHRTERPAACLTPTWTLRTVADTRY